MSSPELFLVGTCTEPICDHEDCDIKENPDHFTTIQLSEEVKDAIHDAIDYLRPDVSISPTARNLVSRLILIFEADKP